MSRTVSESTFLDHRITVEENARAVHTVSVRTAEGQLIYRQNAIFDDGDAVMIGKAFVSGRNWQSIHDEPIKEVPTPVRPGTHMVRVKDVLVEASGLMSGAGENPEYDRALIELTGRIVGLDLSEEAARTVVQAMLGVMA